MSAFDQAVPPQLLKIQKWFGELISRPLIDLETINPRTPRGEEVEIEAKEFIAPSPFLKPHERLQIYNQQYWWRLLNTLQDNFPLLLRLFGAADFADTLGIPYLLASPPNHWSLNDLGNKMPKWIHDTYSSSDKELVFWAAMADRAYCELFFKPLYPSLSGGEASDLVSRTLYLQPHVKLFEFPFDLISFRHACLKETPEHWLENDFPHLTKGTTFCLVFRKRKGPISSKNISETEYLLLKQIEKGASIDALCDWIGESSESIQKSAEESLEKWFKEWTSSGILTSLLPSGFL